MQRIPFLVALSAWLLAVPMRWPSRSWSKMSTASASPATAARTGRAFAACSKGGPSSASWPPSRPNPRRAKELADVLGKPLAASYDAVIQNPAVDIVAVTCDPCDKAAIVEKAARAGKHIFLNKPPCDSLDAARRIVRAVTEHKVWLVHDIPMVRSVPVFARLLDEIRTQPYGKVMGYHHLFGMNFDPAFDLKGDWPERLDPAAKSGGGEMTNMGCYAIDFAVALLGRPRAVTAKWRKEWDVYRQADVENFGQIVLDYGDFYAFLEVGKQQLAGPSRHSNLMTLNFEHRALVIDASAQLAAVNHVPVDWERVRPRREGRRLRRPAPLRRSARGRRRQAAPSRFLRPPRSSWPRTARSSRPARSLCRLSPGRIRSSNAEGPGDCGGT